MKQQGWPGDVVFFLLAFLGLSLSILLVNLFTDTWNGRSGHALATVLAGLLLFKFRWKRLIPSRTIVAVFSVVAGFGAVFYLYLLQLVSSMVPAIAFDAMRGYEVLFAFTVNAMIFAGTFWCLRKRVAA